jgi:hypothetical protein
VPQSFQYDFRRAETGEGGLYQVQADQRSQQQEIGRDQAGQEEGKQDQTSGQHTDSIFDSHQTPSSEGIPETRPFRDALFFSNAAVIAAGQ